MRKSTENFGVTYLTDRLGGEEEGVSLLVSVCLNHCDGRIEGGKDVGERREGVKIAKANCLGGTVGSYGGGLLEGRKLHHWPSQPI